MGLELIAMMALAGQSAMQGKRQERAQKASLEEQRGAQSQATARAQSQAKQARQAEAKAGKKPDVSSRLGQERMRSAQGPGATMLTGAGGVRPGSMLLGRKGSLMGGGY